jgi:YD repeat-containing protein
LGLFDTSLTQLGRGFGGSAGLGQSREGQYVNAANGNLVLQGLDETLLVRGLSATFLRTYNSRGTVDGAGQDGWVTGFERRLTLAGALTDANSTVTLSAGDGQSLLFTRIAANTYRATSGDGAHDLLTWNATARTWTHREGSSLREQTFADHESLSLKGRLIAIRETKSDGATPAQFDVVYDASGRVSQVRSVDGAAVASRDAIVFGYNAAGQLTSVSTREGGVIRSQVAYGYDAVGRLAWVQTDLTPTSSTDNTWDAASAAANDGRRFRTSFTYVTAAASDLRIASVASSDGARATYTYEADGQGGQRIKTATRGSAADGSAQTTTFTYRTNATDVTDGAGRMWTYEYDASRQLVAVLEPAVAGLRQKTSYTYDAAGNVTRVTQATGATGAAPLDTVFQYDGNGNRTLQRDRLGNTVTWTYSADSQLLSETRYTLADADGLDAAHTGTTNLPSGALTTRYAYDLRGRLRFAVSAAGEVRELTYATSGNGIGQVATERRYLGDRYAGATFTENDLNTWATAASSIKKSNSALTAYAYDAKGRLQQSVSYASVGASGAGVLDAATDITNYSHDAQGLLRQKIVVHGAGRTLAAAAPAGSEVTDYVYDGMGRLLSVLSRDAATAAMPDPVANPAGHATWLAANDATTVLTTYAHVDSTNQLRVTQDTGLLVVETRNQAGDRISVTESGVVAGTLVNRTTQNFYDASGRLRAAQDASGARTYFFYDAAGRPTASVDATGAVTETRYDGVGRAVGVVSYATAVDTSSWLAGGVVTKTSLVFAATAPALLAGQAWVQTNAANDRLVQTSYDSAGRVATQTDASGLVTTYAYDGGSRLLSTTVAKPGDATAIARVTRLFYDSADRLLATLDAAGFLSESVYDAGGRVVKTVRHATATAANLRAAGTLDQLRPAAPAPGDQVTRHFYSARGLQIGSLDAEGFLTEFVYDEAANQRATVVYGKVLTSLAGSETFAALRTSATTNVPANVIASRTSQRSFDALGRVSVETDHQGTVTRYRYDEASRLVSTETGNIASEIRESNQRFDVFGNLVGQLGGEGSVHLVDGMTEAQLDAVYAQYGVRHAYDLVGRRTESIDAAGNKTWYFHDARGRQTFVVRGVASAQGVANAEAEVTETRYSALGQVTETLAYTGRIIVVTPGSRASVLSALGVLSFNATVDTRNQLRYDQRGLVTEMVDAQGFRTTQAYTAFGELRLRSTYEADGSTVFATRTHAYDQRGLLATLTESGGAVTRAQGFQYDAFGRLVGSTDARGAAVTYAYDRLGRQVGQTALAVSGRSETTATTYDAFGQVLTQRNALNQDTQFRYDDVNRSLIVTTPEGVAVTTRFDRFGQNVQVSQLLPDGSTATSTTTYNRDGQAIGHANALGQAATSTYDARGLLLRSTDASGRNVDYRYDAVGRVLTRTEDAGGLNLATTYTYDGQGRQLSVTDAAGLQVTMKYDRKGNLVETVRDPAGLALKTVYTWDRDGRQLDVTEGAGTAAATTTRYGYDKLGRRTSEVQGAGALNLTTSYVFDGNDNVVARTDASGRTTRYSYDAANRLRFAIDAGGNVSEFTYDAAGRMTATRQFAKAADIAAFPALPAVPDEAAMASLVTTQALANSAQDEVNYRVLDRDGRLVMSVDGAGNVASTAYDSAGRQVLERRHANAVALSAALRASLAAGTATVADVGATTSATDQVLRTVHDAAGRAIYVLDATGSAVRTWHDAAGRVVAQVRFATPLNLAAITNATTVAQLDGQLTWSSADQSEYRVYDAAGRLGYRYGALGLLTQASYDGAGRLVMTRAFANAHWVSPDVQSRLFAGTATVSDFSAFASANEATARVQYQVHDAAGRVRYSVSRSATGQGTVDEVRYDAASRVTAQVAHGSTVAFNPAHTEATLTAALAGSARRTTAFVYDAAGRQRYAIDATGALSESRYDAAGRVTSAISYGLRPPVSATTETDLTNWVQTQSAANIRHAQSSYDAAGRLSARTDALNQAERYTYDGTSRLLTQTDRNGAVWTYQYDASGRRTAEISPQVNVTAVDPVGQVTSSLRSVVTRFTYDALGNLLSRTDNADAPTPTDRRRIEYAYDSRGNQIRTTFPDPGVVDPLTGAISATGVRPTTELTYNALGQAVVQKDVRGFYSYRTYDALGRIAYEVDQERNVTSYGYSAFGEQTTLRRHAAALNPAVIAGWTEGQPLTLAQIQIAGAVTSAATDRTLTTTYTALGQAATVVQSAVAYFKADGTAAGGAPTTTFVYNGFGDLVQENVLLEGALGQPGAVWAQTHRYYDALGRNTVTVDAEGHVTQTRFNATGEATDTTEFARALAQPAVVNVVPGLPAPGDAASGYDRTVRWTYDALGRKVTETSVRHYQRIDGSTGVRDVAKSFAYDNEGRATAVTDDTGTVRTVYDALGRSVSLQESARAVVVNGIDGLLTASAGSDLQSAGATVQRSPYATMAYDAFGNAVAVRRYANGKDGAADAVPDDARDQIQLTRHDWQGRAVWERNPDGAVVTRRFDAADNVTELRYGLTGNDGRTAVVRVLSDYDDTGRLLATQTLRDQFLNGTPQGTVTDASESVLYNAFGEITQKTHAGVAGTLAWTYDAAGRLATSNETGAVRSYGYNLAGHQVRTSQAAYLNATDGTVQAVTLSRTDRLGRTVEVTLPSHNAVTATTAAITQRFDRWGNVLQVIDARGYQTDYEYNDLNQLVRETRPLVLVVAENGAETWERPVNRWYYDALGRLVATRDANGNLRSNEYDAAGRLMASRDAFGNATRHVYDALGNQRASQNPLGYITFKEYDRQGRNVAIGDYLTSQDGVTRAKSYQQRFTLNENGDRRVVTDAGNASATYDFDSGQRLLRSRTAMGVVAEYGYDAMGRKVRESNALSGSSSLTDRDGELVRVDESSWDYDVFGRLTDHNNLSGRDSNYGYSAASGQQTTESAAGGLGITAGNASKTITYYANGRVREMVEATGARFRYEYDASGNRTVEESTFTDAYGQQVRSLTRTTYDSNNRIQRVVQDDLLSGKRVFDLITDYDANGNRRRVRATSGYGPNVDGIVVANSAPVVIRQVEDRVVRKGIAAEFRLLFTDIFRDLEQDALTLSITQGNGSALPAWLVASRDPDTGEIVFSANPGAGLSDQDITVKLTATETANGANAISETFLVKVRTNSTPELVQAGNAALRVKTNQPWNKDLVVGDHFRDADVGDVLSLSIENALPAWLQVDTSSPGVIRLSGTPTAASTFSLRLRATDQSGAFVVKQFDITTAANATPTVVTAPGATDAIIGRQFEWSRPLANVFTDLDGDALQVTAKQADGSALPAWMSFQYLYDQATPEIRFTGSVPASEVNGRVYTITLTARDVDGAVGTTTLTVRVFSNRAPVATAGVTALPSLRVQDNYAPSFPLSTFFSDAEGDALTITPVFPVGSTLPAWLKVTVDYATGIVSFTGRPTANSQAGSFTFSLTATDIAGLVATKTFSLVVGTDTAPVRSGVALPDQTLSIGRNFSFTLPAGLFTDADGDAITLQAYQAIQVYESEPGFEWWDVRLDSLPAWLSFNPATRTFTGTVPAGQAAGSFTVRVHGVDSRGRTDDANSQRVGGAGISSDGDIRITLQAWANGSPTYVAGSLPGRTVVHGGSVDFPLPAGAFIEPDGDTLSYTGQVLVGANWVDISQIGLSVNASTGRITGTAINLTQDSFSARIIARDPQGLPATGTFAFTVTNTPPTVAAIAAQAAGRNAPFSLTLASFFSDVNGHALTYAATGLPAGLTLNTATGLISGTLTAALGSYTVSVSASDGRGGSIGTSFTLTVQNSAPVPPTSIPNQVATAGSAWSYVVPAFTDPNGDVLAYTASGLPAWVTFNPATRTLSGTAGTIGSWTLTIRATDPAGAFATQSFVLTTPSAPPVYNGGLANQTALPGVAFNYTFGSTAFTDPNGDPLTYSVDGNGVALPGWLAFNPSLRQFTGTPTTAGTFTVRVWVTDGTTPVSRTFTITVPNVGPGVGTPLPDRSGTQGQAVSWLLPAGAFSDANGDAIGYTLMVERPAYNYIDYSNPYEPELRERPAAWVSGSSAGLSIAADGSITGNLWPLYGDGETFYGYRAKIIATSTGGSAESLFNIGINVAPVAPGIPTLNARQNLPWSYTVPVFSDGNFDPLTYAISGLPAGLSFNAAASSRVISGTATTPGSYAVTVTASDGRGGTASATFTLNVQANNAPTAPTVGNASATVGTAFSLGLPEFGDADYDALTYTATGLPPGLAFAPGPRVISGTPAAVGTWTVTYSANDGRGGVTSVAFLITVGNTPPANRAPQVNAGLVDQYAESGYFFEYVFAASTFSDPDGNPLTYTAARADGLALPAWLQFDAANRRFYGTPGGIATQSFNIRVTARDPSGLTAFDDFVLDKFGSGGGGQIQRVAANVEQGGGKSYRFDMGTGQLAKGSIASAAPAMASGTASMEELSTVAASLPVGTAAIPVQVKDQWFTYDAENRIKVSGGALVGAAGAAGTAIRLGGSSAESYELMYDAAGSVVGRLVTFSSHQVVYRTAYDLRGRKVLDFHGESLSNTEYWQGGISKQYIYDAANRLVETRSYFASGTEIESRLDGEGMPIGVPMQIGGWLSGAEQFSYDADGRLVWQLTLDRANGLQGIRWEIGGGDDATQRTSLTVLVTDSRVDYTAANGTSGYDQLGRVSVYRYTSRDINNATHTYTSSYQRWEGYQEGTVTGTSTNNNYRATTNTLTYDGFGRLTKQVDNTPLPSNLGVLHDRARTYAYDGEGKVLSRREGTIESNVFTQVADNTGAKANFLYVHAAGQQQAELKEGGQIRTRSGYTYNTPQIEALNGRGNYAAGGGSVTVQQGETLQSLAQRVYGNSSLWYVLADANGLSDPEGQLVAGTQLNTPSVTVSSNDAQTFKPYNPNEAIGSTAPGLPFITPPPKQSCNAVAMIIMVVVAIVVTVYTAGAAATAFSGASSVLGTAGAGAAGGIGAVGAAALTGGGVIAGSGVVLGTGAAIAGAAVGGFVGSVAAQAVGSAMGVASFSWRSAAAAGVTAAITAGAGAWLHGAGKVAEASKFYTTTDGVRSLTQLGKFAQGVAAYGGGVVGSAATGQKTNFSWSAVAASAIGSFVSVKLGGRLSVLSGGETGPNFLSDFMGSLVSGSVNASARRLMGLGRQDWEQITTDAFGNALGNAAVKKIQLVVDQRRMRSLMEDSSKVDNGLTGRSKEQIREIREKLKLSRSEYRVFADLLESELKVYMEEWGAGRSHAEALLKAAPLLSQNPDGLRFYKVEVTREDARLGEYKVAILGRVAADKVAGALFVNGILNDRDRAAALSAYHIAAEMNLDAGDSYYVAHNPTRGAFADLWESLRDKIGWTTPAAQEIANLLTSASDAGRKISIVAHSQGGAMVTEGIRVAAAAYGKPLQGISVSYHSGANNQAATNRILDKAGVKLFGGLQATGYRSAPNDLVPQIVGFNWAPDPFKFFRSIFDSHLLLKSGTTPANTLSPHTFPYKPNEGLYPKIDLPKPGGG